MDEREFERRPGDDENDIEIVDLDADNLPKTEARTTPPRARSPLAPRFSSRQRRVQLVATISIVVLALGILLTSYAPTRNLVKNVLPSSQPTVVPTLSSGQDLFYFYGTPSWGRLFVDGKYIAHLPKPGIEDPLEMSRGSHIAQWNAAPFITQRCTFSVPPNFQADTCSYTTAHVRAIGNTDTAWQINMLSSLKTLPPVQHDALVASLQTALGVLSATDTVQPGEPYAIASPQPNTYTVAHEALTAKLRFVLDSDPAARVVCAGLFLPDLPGCVNNAQDCHLFCDAAPFFEPASSTTRKEWDVFIVARAAWDYALTNGTVIARDQPDSSLAKTMPETGAVVSYGHMIPARIIWNGKSWQTSILYREAQRVFDNSGNQNPICATTWDEVQVDPLLDQLPSDGQQIAWKYVSGPHSAAGCLAVGVLLSPNAPQSSWAYCLHRFGVLLAANDVAHKAWPDMPVASPRQVQATGALFPLQSK